MKSLQLGKYYGKRVKIVCDDGQIFNGKVGEYFSALDNPEEEASICIGSTEFLEHEIVSIEEI